MHVCCGLVIFGDFLLSVFHIRTPCEPVEVKELMFWFCSLPLMGILSVLIGGAASPEDLAQRGSEVELWTAPRPSLPPSGPDQLAAGKGTCFPRTSGTLLSHCV